MLLVACILTQISGGSVAAYVRDELQNLPGLARVVVAVRSQDQATALEKKGYDVIHLDLGHYDKVNEALAREDSTHA